MHIMEGYLPLAHAVGWTLASGLPVALGLREIKRQAASQPEIKMLLGVSGAFTFALSALKLPSVTGSCSHPTGTGLGALLFGPLVMAPIGLIVLLFQALLLAHGGLSTLGANTFSMAVVGPFVAYGVYRAGKAVKIHNGLTVFLAAALGDMATYLTTAFQLALAHPSQIGGFPAAFAKFAGIFAFTQIPLAISEGLLTLLIWNLLMKTHTMPWNKGKEVEG